MGEQPQATPREMLPVTRQFPGGLEASYICKKRHTRSSLVVQQVKDLASLLCHRFDPWPGNLHILRAQLKKGVPPAMVQPSTEP